ncbi:hypothetical protein FQZ97_1143310 [compost metagenome]
MDSRCTLPSGWRWKTSIVVRRAAWAGCGTSVKYTGSSAYSRAITTHMSRSASRINRGSKVSSRSRSMRFSGFTRSRGDSTAPTSIPSRPCCGTGAACPQGADARPASNRSRELATRMRDASGERALTLAVP